MFRELHVNADPPLFYFQNDENFPYEEYAHTFASVA
jgi:hypothetical protein